MPNRLSELLFAKLNSKQNKLTSVSKDKFQNNARLTWQLPNSSQGDHVINGTYTKLATKPRLKAISYHCWEIPIKTAKSTHNAKSMFERKFGHYYQTTIMHYRTVLDFLRGWMLSVALKFAPSTSCWQSSVLVACTSPMSSASSCWKQVRMQLI